MEPNELLDELLGTGLPEEKLLERLLPAEKAMLERLVESYSLQSHRLEIIQALYRFKQTLQYYVGLMDAGWTKLNRDDKEKTFKVFSQIQYNLERDSRSCFSNGGFFKPLRFLLHSCSKLGVSTDERKTYIEWVCNFPVIPEDSIQKVFDHEIYPANLPFVYMSRTAGLTRDRLVDGLKYQRICSDYKKFLRELNVGTAHTLWFNRRYAGSYGSRQ